MLKKILIAIFATTCSWVASGVCLSQAPQSKYHKSGISDRDLLGLGDFHSRLSRSKTPGIAAFQNDTLRILAIRIEFQKPTGTLTTGDGKFDLRSPSETEVLIDPPPHNKTYFEQQLTALANYYRRVSRGRLILQSEVYPQNAGSYTVSQEMSYYSPTQSPVLLDQRLAELFQEAFLLADAGGDIDFSQYDSFILFHAGVGGDFAFDFDPTPQDIPSVFLDFDTLKENLAPDDAVFEGISVNAGSYFIRDGMILPETQSQLDFEIGLLGTMTLMFGHQLGLPNLFNSETGRSGIGVFGLMDQGSGNFSGLIPAEPSAWAKMVLGWERGVEVRNEDNLSVAASLAKSQSRIYRVPINSEEYFLVENRQRDFNRDNIAVGRDANGVRVEFLWDQQGQRILAESRVGVITQVSEYDFGLPGSGILIWHIDERVIRAGWEDNRVNADPNRRGVDVEEADGAQDIGQSYGFLDPGAGAENGVIEDMFWGSNEINLLVNDAQTVEFTTMSEPNSRANSGADTRIRIYAFSEPDTVMTFSVQNQALAAGFPQFTGVSDIFTNSPVIYDLDANGSGEIILTAIDSNNLFIWNSDGSKFIANQDSASSPGPDGTLRNYPVAVAASPTGSMAFSPAVLESGNGIIITVATDEVVAGYRPADSDLDGRADEVFLYASSEPISTSPMAINSDGRIVVGTEDGSIIVLAQDGSEMMNVRASDGTIAGFALYTSDKIAYTSSRGEIGIVTQAGASHQTFATQATFESGPIVGDLDKDGVPDIIAVGFNGDIYALHESGESLPGFPRQAGQQLLSAPAIADIDADGFLEILFIGDNSIFAFNHVGNLEQSFPVRVAIPKDGSVTRSSPVVADLDGDNVPEILVGASLNQIAAFHHDGATLDGFPLSSGGTVNSTPFLFDVDNDGLLDVAAGSDDGFINVWNTGRAFDPDDIKWGGFLSDARHSNRNNEVLIDVAPGEKLLPVKSVYNYPNPTEGNSTTIRYTLNSPAQVRVTVFDMAGELVDDFNGPGFGPADNEVTWSLAEIESGIYLARVEASGNGVNEAAIIKIAVVK